MESASSSETMVSAHYNERFMYVFENHNVDNLLLFSNPFIIQQRHKLNLHQKNRFSCRTERSSKPNTLMKKNDKVTVNE
jgi:hypothetical protein